MIIVKLMGGMGNQLFQYAAARRLAHYRNTSLMIDLSWFSNIAKQDTVRTYGLGVFAIQEIFAPPAYCKNFRRLNDSRLVAKILDFVRPSRGLTYFQEKQFHFDADVLNLPDNLYLEGYWQSEKYFKDITDIIRNEFTIKDNFCNNNKQLIDIINNTESVSIHVRRGDYLSNKTNINIFAICSLEYYSAAANKIASITNNPHFIVFSDDPEWAKRNINLKHTVIFTEHQFVASPHHDLHLMSMCKHNIIANSSFSWWGAWLNSSPDKVVIAPKFWFNDSLKNTGDLIPEDWIKL